MLNISVVETADEYLNECTCSLLLPVNEQDFLWQKKKEETIYIHIPVVKCLVLL